MRLQNQRSRRSSLRRN